MRDLLVVQLSLAFGVALGGGCGGTVAGNQQSAGAAGDAVPTGGIDGDRTDGMTGGIVGISAIGGRGVGGAGPRGSGGTDIGVDAGSGAAAAGDEVGAGATGGGEASCSNVTPCGGDVVGIWTVTSSCLAVGGEVDLTWMGLGCTSASITGSLQVAGTWTASPDGTFADNTTTRGDEQLELPASCLTVSGTITTCERISAPVAALGYASVICVDSVSGGCTCSATVEQTGAMGSVSMGASTSGTFMTSDNVVTTGPEDSQYSYCVSANTLTMTPQSETPKTTRGTIALRKLATDQQQPTP